MVLYAKSLVISKGFFMGKDSLIKSTSKKKTPSKKAAEEKKVKKVKKTAPKPAARATVKPGPPPPQKASAQEKPIGKTDKSVAPPQKKQPTLRELLARKFDTWKPETLFRIQEGSRQNAAAGAPPAVSASDPAEAARLKALLLKKYDYQMLVKAAAEKAAAEKATAEKAAAEKAAAEKAAIRYQPSAETAAADPAGKLLKYGIAGFVVLILLVIGSSFMNARNFYIKPTEGATEIWQGTFAPKGARLMISLPGMFYTDPLKDVYSQSDVFPLIFRYYIDKADTLLDVPGLPDFEGVKSYLDQALEYAVTPELASAARSRLNTINLMVLLYKADVAASKDTINDLEASLKYLQEAYDVEMDQLQKELILQKTAAASAKLQLLKAQAVEAEEKAAAIPESTE
jgi:hypothetical protein